MKCPKCGYESITNVNFCPSCGLDLTKPYEENKEEKKESVKDLVNVLEEVKEEKTEEVKEEHKKEQSSASYDYDDNMYDMKDIEENKILALFSYLSFLFIIPLIAKPNSRYCRFHVNQGIILCITEAIVGAICAGLEMITLTAGLVSVVELTTTALDLLTTILGVYGIYNAVTGNAKELPVIGKFRILK